MTELSYLAGFGNQHQSEAVAGALPVGRNSPQRVALGLYAELLSGSAFTAARAENQRSWLYRRQPSVVVGSYQPLAAPLWRSGAAEGELAPPDPLRWHPLPGEAGQDFVDSLRTLVVNGDPAAQLGMGAHVYALDRAMGRRALVNADGEMLLVPQQGRLLITTELGRLEVAPGYIALLPRGLAFKVDPLDGEGQLHRGYVCENFGAAFRLPELGPIGSNGLANARDFEAPVAWFEHEAGAYEIVKRYGGRLWRATQAHSPFNVVAWHGNLAPCRYELARFMTINTVSFDHPDPSIFTVLTSPSDTPGWANVDFVIFPPRWMVAEDTFRPPWYHRNVMSEFMGLVLGQYDAKPGGFKPGGASLHNSMVPHGPDTEAFAKASAATLQPHKLEATMAFMFETRWPLRPTAWALQSAPLDTAYADCWQGLKDEFPHA
ncbi:MAG: homogentisate 1,2-dioxygenase [Roseateles sp.]|nr:MAG: homogentisate 1,2-dioxygenase [Roseateles sp.]